MIFHEFQTWSGVFQIGVLAGLLLIGNVMRRKIPFFKRSLLPTAVIAGFTALLLKEFVLARFITEADMELNNHFLSVVTYHAIALGFIALGLKVHEKLDIITHKAHGMFSGLVIVASYLLQGFVGITVTVLLSWTLFKNLFQASGLLLPMGFGQGPGQASNIGHVYSSYGFLSGGSFGLAIASIGFLWASIGGIIYLNYLLKKGMIYKQTDARATYTSNQEIESPDEIPLAEAIDKFTIQVALVLVVYLITFGVLRGIDALIEIGVLGDFGVETIRPLIWGFNFIFGMLFAILAKHIFLWLRKKNIMTRQYPNNYMLNRIAGCVFDFMIIAAIAAIRFEQLKGLWIPLLILTSVGGFATVAYVTFICKRVYYQYPIEGTMAMFGMLTGTASTGVILLREVDPNFKTPAANDIVVGSSTAILFGFPILLLVGIAPRGNTALLGTYLAVIVLLIIVNAILLKFNPKRIA